MENRTNWFEGRIPLGELRAFLRRKVVPAHRHTFWYLFGGLTLLFFVVQLVSGVLLSLYYQPTPATAYESVARISDEIQFGWIVRGIHHWSAHLLVFCSLVHMASKYFFVAYRKPREGTWISGVILLGVVLGFAFTGYLLPWTTEGYFATLIGVEIPASMPLVGEVIARVLRGGDYVDGATLTRVFSLHAIILPLVSLVLIAFHLIQNQYTGSAVPKGERGSGGIPFSPDFIYRDALAWIAGIMFLLTLVLFFPVSTTQKADILASPPEGIRPEWYFIPLYQTIKWLPGSILGVNTEILINIATSVFILSLILLPWIHKNRDETITGVDRVFRVVGITGIFYVVLTMVIAYTMP